MTPAELHAHCELLQQTLIDLIAAVRDLQSSAESEHLQVVLDAAMQVVDDDVPPLTAEGNSAYPG